MALDTHGGDIYRNRYVQIDFSVNVVQSKEMVLTLKDVPYIVAQGRKGGSNIAACICNALIYQL